MTYSAPPSRFPTEVWTTPFSRASLGLENRSMTASTDASTAWGTANLALYVPFVADDVFTVIRFGWLNGTVVAGNVDVGLFSSAWAKLLSTGSTAQATTSAIQVVTPAATSFGPGRYYLGISLSDATGTIFCSPLTAGPHGRWGGCAQETSALPLPATATPVTFATAFLPWFGFCQRDTA